MGMNTTNIMKIMDIWSMDVKNSNIPPAPRYTLPRVGWSVGKAAHIVKTPVSDRSHVYFEVYVFRKKKKARMSSLVCQKPENPF